MEAARFVVNGYRANAGSAIGSGIDGFWHWFEYDGGCCTCRYPNCYPGVFVDDKERILAIAPKLVLFHLFYGLHHLVKVTLN
jgi:hypothetical protein